MEVSGRLWTPAALPPVKINLIFIIIITTTNNTTNTNCNWVVTRWQ